MLALKESFLRTRRTRDLPTNHEDLFPSRRPYPLICGSKDSDDGKAQGRSHMRDARIVSNEEPTFGHYRGQLQKRKPFRQNGRGVTQLPFHSFKSLPDVYPFSWTENDKQSRMQTFPKMAYEIEEPLQGPNLPLAPAAGVEDNDLRSL